MPQNGPDSKSKQKNRLTHMEEKQEKMLDKTATDSAVDRLSEITEDRMESLNFQAVYKNLDDPDWRKGHNLDYKRTEQVRTFFHGQEADQNHATKKVHDDYEQKIGDAFAKGKMGNVSQMIQGDNPLSGDERRIWASAIESPEKGVDTRCQRGETGRKGCGQR